jgi:hypothetical protein
MVASPCPLVREERLIQLTVLVAFQLQPLGPVSATFPDPPALSRLLLAGEREKSHWSLDWATQKVCPAIVIFPLRAVEPVFCVIEYVTVAFPAPLAPEVTVIQLALLEAVQPQELAVVIATLPVAAVASKVLLAGEIAKLQLVPAACVTVTVWPATVTVPVREAPPLLSATLNPAVPLPVTLLPDVSVIQLALLVAVHAHVLPVVALTVSVPAVAPKDWLVGDALKVQPAAA